MHITQSTNPDPTLTLTLTHHNFGGWTPPPRADGLYELPIPPPDIQCSGLPCLVPAGSGYLAGHTMLFDVEADMFEAHPPLTCAVVSQASWPVSTAVSLLWSHVGA